MPRFLFRPRWLAFHALVIGAVAVMISLGFWQLRRLDERRDLNAAVTERIDQPPVPLESLLRDIDTATATNDANTATHTDIESIENRLAVLEGTYLLDQVVLFNRSQDGRAVDNVLTALVLVDGATVVVNRGAIPVGATPPPPPAVGVEVIGRVRPSEERQRGGLSDAETEVLTEVRRVDLAQLERRFGELVPLYVELLTTDPAATQADPSPLSLPDLGEGNHLSYAGQWFIFALCVAIGWVLAIRRSLTSAARDEQTPSDSPLPDAVGSTTALP